MILFVDILFRDTCSIYLTADVWPKACQKTSSCHGRAEAWNKASTEEACIPVDICSRAKEARAGAWNKARVFWMAQGESRKIYQTGVYPRVLGWQMDSPGGLYWEASSSVPRRTWCCHRCPPSTLWNTGHDKSKASGAEKWHACPAHKLRLEIKPATKQMSEALPRPCQDLAEEGK